jgi:DNA invertase Pin-like site-specific DNA recombinase
MTVAAYAQVSTEHQAETQTIKQQLEQLTAYASQQGWSLSADHIYRDEGHSGPASTGQRWIGCVTPLLGARSTAS